MIIPLLLMLAGTPPAPGEVSVQLVVSKLDARPYHRPYVAIWIETTKRKGVQTLAVWHEQEEWLKDMRQWWRKLGRDGAAEYDGVSGATRKPGSYVVRWKPASGSALEPGEYYINIEAAREQGGRDYLRQKIRIGAAEAQVYKLEGDLELGTVIIKIEGASHE